MSDTARYEITTTWSDGDGVGGAHTRLVEFDGERVVRAWKDDEEKILAPDYMAAVEAVLVAHERSGHRGGRVALEAKPA